MPVLATTSPDKTAWPYLSVPDLDTTSLCNYLSTISKVPQPQPNDCLLYGRPSPMPH